MKASEIRELSRSELETKISEVKKNLFNLKFQKASGQLNNPMKVKNLKRDVAKIETVAREQELGLKVAKAAEKSEKSVKSKKVIKAKETKELKEKTKKEITKTKVVKRTVKKEKA